MSSSVLSVASVIEKNRLSSEVPFLVVLDIDVIDPATGSVVETMHIVHNTEVINYRGFAYQPAVFDIELRQEAGAQQSVKLSIKDYTKAVQGRMQAYGGGVGFNVTVMIVNGGALTLPPEVSEYFQIIGAEAANYTCTFTLGAENTLSKTFPRRRQTRDFCQWRYKSTDCGYTGGLATCDLTLRGTNGCDAHSNTIRFGAFSGINTRDVNYG